MTRGRARSARIAATLAAAAVGLTGCSFSQGLYGLPLPGAVGSGGYKVTAVFDNVSDLVPQSAVKVADVTVGTVDSIKLDPKDLKARVVMSVKRSVHLPSNSIAILQQTSLLGEKFIELGPPPGMHPASTELAQNGSAVLQNGDTVAYPDVETVLGALSLLLNGGGLDKIQTINYELGQALTGREAAVRGLLNQLNTFVGGLNTQKSEIVRALDATDRLTSQLAVQRQTIATALDDLGPGIKVLADQRRQLVSLLAGLSNLGKVATRVINASKQATVADLTALKPIVTRIAAAGGSLPRSLDLLLDYPFPRDATTAVPGVDTALYATIDLSGSMPSLCTSIPGLKQTPLGMLLCKGVAPAGAQPAPGAPGQGLLSGPDIPGLSGLGSTVQGLTGGVTGGVTGGAGSGPGTSGLNALNQLLGLGGGH